MTIIKPLPDGYFAVPDPDDPNTITCWRVKDDHGARLAPSPQGALYGPVLYRRDVPKNLKGPERRTWVRHWYETVDQPWHTKIREAIAADPAGAAARWRRETERCASCRAVIRAEDLPDSAAAGRGRAVEVLTDEQRDAMAVDLRRAGHPEALIAQALGIGTTRINRVARRAGVGAPLRPRRNGSQA